MNKIISKTSAVLFTASIFTLFACSSDSGDTPSPEISSGSDVSILDEASSSSSYGLSSSLLLSSSSDLLLSSSNTESSSSLQNLSYAVETSSSSITPNNSSSSALAESSSSAILLLSSSSLRGCEHLVFNPSTHFCYDGEAVLKCGGNEYNLSTQFCYGSSKIGEICGANINYNPDTYFCYENNTYNKCNGMIYNPSTHICSNNVASPAMCNSVSYNPTSQFCLDGTLKEYGPVTYGGQTYKILVIGTQVWMAENLNYNASGSKCYDDIPSNCTKYGRLYDWATAITVCPGGWHLPTEAEWNTLTSFIETDKGCSSCDAKYLKATSGWNSGNGLDSYEFAALPGGYGNSDGGFDDVGNNGNWWSATEYNAYGAYFRLMYYDYESVSRNDGYKAGLQSVRCVQD